MLLIETSYALQDYVALRSIYLNMGTKSHQSLQSNALLFLGLSSIRLHFILICYKDM